MKRLIGFKKITRTSAESVYTSPGYILHGPWRLSRSPALAFALPARYFANSGLPSLLIPGEQVTAFTNDIYRMYQFGRIGGRYA